MGAVPYFEREAKRKPTGPLCGLGVPNVERDTTRKPTNLWSCPILKGEPTGNQPRFGGRYPALKRTPTEIQASFFWGGGPNLKGTPKRTPTMCLLLCYLLFIWCVLLLCCWGTTIFEGQPKGHQQFALSSFICLGRGGTKGKPTFLGEVIQGTWCFLVSLCLYLSYVLYILYI